MPTLHVLAASYLVGMRLTLGFELNSEYEMLEMNKMHEAWAMTG